MVNKSVLILVVLAIFLGGCSKKVEETKETTPSGSGVTIGDIFKSKKTLAYSFENKLWLVDPYFVTAINVYEFKKDEVPAKIDENTFIVDSKKQMVMWYSPVTGLMMWTPQERNARSVVSSNDWFNKYPHFVIDTVDKAVYFMENGGKVLVKRNIDDGSEKRIEIPYPFGTVFKISFNHEWVLFVSAYGQDRNNAQYLMAKLAEGNGRVIETKGSVGERNLATWLPDNSGFLVISTDSKIYKYDVNGVEVGEWFKLPEGESGIDNLSSTIDGVFVHTKSGYWHKIDGNTAVEIARFPDEIVSELNHPQITPIEDNKLLINDVMMKDELSYKRMWLSDYKGIKKLVIPKYSEEVVKTISPSL